MADSAVLNFRFRFIFRQTIFLLIAFCAYIIIGGVIFQRIEYQSREQHVEEASQKLEKHRATLLKVLWGQTLASSEEEWLEKANERLDMYEKKIKKYFLDGIDLHDDEGPEDEDLDNPWTLTGSIFYCFTVVTTIGFGNLAPSTATGRFLTIFYGTFGIPLTLILLTEMGKLLTLILKALWSTRDPDLDDSDEFSFNISLSLGFTIAYLLFGTFLFTSLEDWTFSEAAYYAFVTFSTIGFGDIVPQNQGYALLTMVYAISAMSMLAMCFTVIQNQLDLYMTEKRQDLENWWYQRQVQRMMSSMASAAESVSAKESKIPRPSDGTGSNVRYRTRQESEEEEEEEEED